MIVQFKRKTRINNSSVIGGYSGGGSDIDVSNLQYVPCDRVSDADNWLIPDKPIRVPNGISEFNDVKANNTTTGMLYVSEDAMLNWAECQDLYAANTIQTAGSVKGLSGEFTGDIIAYGNGTLSARTLEYMPDDDGNTNALDLLISKNIELERRLDILTSELIKLKESKL